MSTRYYIRRQVITEEDYPVEDPRVDLCSIAETAELVGVSVPAVSAALGRRLTEVIDREAVGQQGRRLALRSEVAAWAAERAGTSSGSG